jgi:hypothetical protein
MEPQMNADERRSTQALICVNLRASAAPSFLPPGALRRLARLKGRLHGLPGEKKPGRAPAKGGRS